MAFVVVYDANVLYPAPLRDTLIRLAQTRLFQARWTEKILDECFEAIAGAVQPRASRPRLDHQIDCEHMRTGDRGLFLYDLLFAGLSREATEKLETEPRVAAQRRRALERARHEGRFEGLLSALELLPEASRRMIRETVMDETRAAWDAGPSDHVFLDESLRTAKAAGVLEGKRDGVLVLLHRQGLSLNTRQRDRLFAVNDVDLLDRMLRAAATATSTDALFHP